VKAHFGGDSRTKLIRAAMAMPTDIVQSIILLDLLHESGPIAASVR
jgi:hypothetical protein